MSGETYTLRFGGIDFSPSAQQGAVEYQLYSLKRGYPAPVTVVAESMIQDGQNERIESHSNREQTIVIGVKAADSESLAEAESALFLEAQQPYNELAWTPPDGLGATTVFDVLWASLKFADDAADWDLDELRGCRVYTLTVAALPFGRSESEVVVAALTSGASPTTTVIANGTSATNWTGTSTVTSASGWLVQTVPTFDLVDTPTGVSYRSLAEWTYTPGAPISFSTEQYLSIDIDPPGKAYSTFLDTVELFADGVKQQIAAIDQPSDGVYRLTVLVTDTSVASLRLRVLTKTLTNSAARPSTTLHRIDNVTKTNQAPNLSTTGRQSTRTIPVLGSARTALSLAVEHASTALGETLVYTAPSLSAGAVGYQPPLRRWKSAGGAGSADTATISGTRSPLSIAVSGATFSIPVSALPKGTYAFMGRLRMDNTTTRTGRLSWTAGSKSYQSPSITLLSSSLAFKTVSLGMMTLPTTDVPASSSASMQIGNFTWSGSDNVDFDELWLFWIGEGAALSWVAAGTAQRLWIDPASTASPQPAIWIGNQADRSDAIHAGASSSAWGVVQARPPFMNVFAATTTAQNPTISGRYFPRFHTHARRAS